MTPASYRINAEETTTAWPPPFLRVPLMSDVTRILSQIESGDPAAAEQLLPLVYAELRKLATAKLAREKPNQTLQATDLVHEAYLRLVRDDRVEQWDSRGHFLRLRRRRCAGS